MGKTTTLTSLPHQTSEQSDSLISHLMLNPLLFASFLLSLLWVDSRNYAATHTHDKRPSSMAKLLSRDKSRKDQQDKDWYWQAKQRKMAKMEIGDALDMRSWMLGVCGMGLLVVLGGSWLVGRWAWGMFGG